MNTPHTPAAVLPHRIGRELTIVRNRMGLSQEDLAARLGVTRQAVAAWEAADGSVTLTTAARWAGLLGLELRLTAADGGESLVDGAGRPAPFETLAMHVAVTGTGRDRAIEALLRDCPGMAVLRLGTSTEDRTPGGDASRFADELVARRTDPTVVVFTLDGDDDPLTATLLRIISAARAGRSIVVVSSAGPVPAEVAQNVALNLSVDSDGSIADTHGRPWRLVA